MGRVKCSLIQYFFLFQNISGMTYPNQCRLMCAAAGNPTDPSIAPCDGTDTNSICATDTVTYANQCELNCAIQRNGSLSACPDQVIIACYRDANGNYQRTFFPCQLACDARNNPAIQIECVNPSGGTVCGKNQFDSYFSFVSRCDYDCVVAHANSPAIFPALPETNTRPCIDSCQEGCSDPVAPLCGSNGQTYNSNCLFNCEADYNATLTKSCDGACPCPSSEMNS